MVNNSNVIQNSTNKNSLILKSKDFTELLFRLFHKRGAFRIKNDIYLGKYDKRSYPFVHINVSFLLMKLMNNVVMKCPFYKNKIQLLKSVYDYKTSYKRLSGLYTIKAEHLPVPQGTDIACLVSTVPLHKQKENQYSLQPHALLKKLTEHFNVIILKTKTPNLCYSFYSIVCTTGLKMKVAHIQNKRLSGQITQWKSLVKNGTLSNGLCYTITETPTLTLHKYLQNNTFELNEWKSILFQLFFTLHMLQKEIPEFVHHNLTPKYIHLKKVPKGGQFIYSLGGKKYYVPNYGYVVKILPSSYSYAKRLYENSIVHNDEFQSTLGLHPDNTSFYDLHLFCNTLYFTKNVQNSVKTLIKRWVPMKLIGNKNNTLLINKRLRIETQKPNKSRTFKKILQSQTFSSFRKLHKNRIVFHPQIRI